jgi:hypothetical protein
MANIYDLTDTWSDGNTTYTSIKMNVTNTASSAASKLIDLQVGSSSLFSVDKDGKIADATELQVDNVKVDGNTVSSTTGNLVLDPYSGSKISLDGLLWPNADGTANQMLQTDGAGNLSWGTPAAGYSNSDVDTHLNTGSATSGQTLQWNGTDYAWGTPASSYGDSDVNANLNTGSATTNQVLSWTGSDYAWTAQTVAFGTADVDAHLNQSNPTSGYVLSWNGSDYAWVAQTGGSSYGDSDVDTHLNRSTATTGQLLSWNGTDYDWITSSAGGGSYADTDVDAHLNTSGASSGQVLGWNGTDYAWVANSGGGGGLADVVDDTTPQLGGNLDLNSSNVTGTGNIDITGTITTTSGGSVVPFYYANQAAFPNATTYHGAIAHSARRDQPAADHDQRRSVQRPSAGGRPAGQRPNHDRWHNQHGGRGQPDRTVKRLHRHTSQRRGYRDRARHRRQCVHWVGRVRRQVRAWHRVVRWHRHRQPDHYERRRCARHADHGRKRHRRGRAHRSDVPARHGGRHRWRGYAVQRNGGDHADDGHNETRRGRHRNDLRWQRQRDHRARRHVPVHDDQD